MVSLRISRCSLMASLSHFPNPFSLSSHKLFALPLPSIYTNHTLLHIYNHRHRHPAISASSNKKPRRVRSNADICNDIREFLSAAGLPEGHVPSMKELSQHGRQDLANIVRRRGYKLIKELLATSTKSDTKEGLIEKQDISSEYEYDSTEGPDTISERPDEMVEDMTEGVPSSSEVFVKQNDSNSANGENIDYAFRSDSKSCMAVESSTNSSWQEKVAKFIQNGELDAIEDDGFGILNEIGTNDGEGFVELDATKELSSLGEEHSEWVLGRSDTAKILNPSISPSKQIVLPAPGNNSPRDGYFSNDGLLNGDYEEDLDVETRKQENQIEANHLKFMLHQKELELSRLKEQIEKEKHALSILQAKAETEISKAQKLITEKDAELHAAEESLSGLEEVQIQYCGDGETVEVAGSFNGWHHPITMDPQPSSIVDPLGSRKSRLWTTVLWLYPGIYEIKFIIDGHWRIDPQRESVTRGTIQNNILRVDR